MADLDLGRVKRNVAKMVQAGAPEAEIDAYIAGEGTSVDAVRAFNPAATAPAPEITAQPSDRGSILDPLVGQGLMFGFGDEIKAGVRAPFTDKTYSEELANARGDLENYREQHPYLSAGAEVAGAVLPALASGGTSLGASLGATAGRRIATGIGAGALQGFGSGEGGVENRLQGAAIGGAVGAAAGGAVEGVTAGLAKRAANKALVASAPATDDIAEQATANFEEMRSLGATISPQSSTAAAEKVNKALAAAGFDPEQHAAAFPVVRRLNEQAGQPVPLEELHILRQQMGDVAGNADAGVRRIGKIMQNTLTDHVKSIKTDDIVSEDARQGANALLKGIELWSRKSKAELMDGMMERAEMHSGGIQAGLRAEFKALAVKMTKDKKVAGSFTQAEREAIKKVAKGGAIENAFGLLGKFAPTNPLMGAVSGIGGFMAGGPMGTAATLAAGEAAKRLSSAATMKNAQLASALVKKGPR
jgi:hypothetical protein